MTSLELRSNSQYGFTPFKDAMIEQNTSDDHIDSGEFYCGPLGTGNLFANHPKTPQDTQATYLEEDRGATIDTSGNIVEMSARDLSILGHYSVSVYLVRPETKTIRKGISVNLWIPNTGLNAIGVLTREFEDDVEDGLAEDNFSGRFYIKTETGERSSKKLFLKKLDLPRVHINLTQQAIGGDVN